MSQAITGVSQSHTVQVTPPAPKASPAAAPHPQKLPQDTVQVSTAAKAALAELTETKSQTVQEANNGDAQARRLLAKEQASQPTKR